MAEFLWNPRAMVSSTVGTVTSSSTLTKRDRSSTPGMTPLTPRAGFAYAVAGSSNALHQLS